MPELAQVTIELGSAYITQFLIQRTSGMYSTVHCGILLGQ